MLLNIIIWVVLFILLAGLVAFAPAVLNSYFRRFPPNVTPTPAVPDCSLTKAPANINLNKPITGGIMRVPAFTMNANATFTLSRDLTIITDNDLVINGTIEVNSSVPVNITLASLNGSVTIANNALVGTIFNSTQPGLPDGISVTDTALYAKAYAAAGRNAGYIKIIAPKGSIDIAGIVGAYGGSAGGWATANGKAGPLGLIGGSALAVGAGGGAGGDVMLCAYEAINISGTVEAGTSGQGGGADATAVNGSNAEAEGGPGGLGGNIHIHGAGPSCQVFIQGNILAGAGDDAGSVAAYGGTGNGKGGKGEALGGKGNVGGTVFFVNCLVANLAGNAQVDARFGGDGGDGAAFGGNGMPANLGKGYQGGAALARGGDGGKPGATPQIPMVDGSVKAGGISSGSGSFNDGKGGDGNASDGIGGTGGRLPVWGSGGNSGGEQALGGTGGKSGTPAIPVTVAPVAGGAAPRGAGGAGPASLSLGTP